MPTQLPRLTLIAGLCRRRRQRDILPEEQKLLRHMRR